MFAVTILTLPDFSGSIVVGKQPPVSRRPPCRLKKQCAQSLKTSKANRIRCSRCCHKGYNRRSSKEVFVPTVVYSKVIGT